MKRILLILALAALSSAMFAALTGYTFNYSLGTYTEITGGTVLGTATSDDQRFVDPAVPAGGTTNTGVGFPIGFNFVFDGVTYDRVAINNNGWISLGQSALTPSVNIATTSAYTPLGSTSAITPADLVARIAGLGRDLQAQTGAELRIETIGSPGSYELVVQWKNYKKYGSSGTGDAYNFQIRLQEAGNKIVVMYGTMTNNATATTIQVGLRGAPATPATNFKCLTTDTVTPSWNPPLVATALSTLALSNAVFPSSGTTYEFSAPLVGVLSVNPNPVNFGDCYVNFSKTLAVTLSNAGGADFTLNTVGLSASPHFTLGSLPSLPEILSPGETFVFNITYAPQDANPHAAVLSINDTRADTNINVQGNGQPDPTISTFPYAEGFEGGPTPVIPFGWTRTAALPPSYNWEIVAADAAHGAAGPYEGLYFARLYVYLAPTNFNPYSLITPPLDLSSGNKKIGYWAWIGADGAPAPLDVEISVDGMATWNLLYSFDLTETNAWVYREHDLSAYTNVHSYVRFKATSNYGYNFCDLGLDYVTVGDMPTVPVELSSFTATLTAQNYVTLNWVSQSESQMVGYLVYRNTTNDPATSTLIDSPLIPATNTSTTQTYSATDENVETGSTYFYWLEAVDYSSSAYHGPVSVTVEGNIPPVLPEITSMRNAYPNPFKGITNIEVGLKAGETGTVTIYNISGQVVRSYTVGEGYHSLNWNGRDANGQTCGSGIYFYRLTTPSLNQTRKLVLAK